MRFFALAYAVLAGFAVAFQLAMAAGAPWGHLTLHGRWPGTLPPGVRALALAQGTVLVLMALVVLARGGILKVSIPSWAIWPVLAVTAASTLANFISPSRPEQLLWVPVTVLMLACCLLVTFR